MKVPDFLENHFTELLLTVLSVAAWMGTIHLIQRAGIPPEDTSWARETASVIIGALIMVLRGSKLGAKSKDDSESTAEKQDGK